MEKMEGSMRTTVSTLSTKLLFKPSELEIWLLLSSEPSHFGWVGRFRNHAKVSKSTRAWLTTIRFGQPAIKDEKGDDHKYGYPRTILSEFQQRPHLPPPPYEVPGEESFDNTWAYSYEFYDVEGEEFQEDKATELQEKIADKGELVGLDLQKNRLTHSDRVPVVLADKNQVSGSWISLNNGLYRGLYYKEGLVGAFFQGLKKVRWRQ